MAIKVKHERPDQRRHHRVTAPLHVALNGASEKYRARDWSLGGLCVEGYPGALPEAGAQVKLNLTLPFQGFDIAFDVEGRVARADDARQAYAIEYTKVGEREMALMQHFIEDLVRGVMSPVADSIHRIDVPVTPVSQKSDAPVQQLVASNSMPVRQMAWVGVYAALGFVVFGYTALVLYSNFFRMEVQTAVVAAPTIKVPARGDGELPYVRVAVGDDIKAGDTLIYFTDYELERDIDKAKIVIEAREAELNSLMLKRVGELETMSEYASVEVKDIAKGRAAVRALKAEAQAADNKASRLKTLLARGLTTQAKVEDAEQWQLAANARLEEKRLDLEEQIRLADTGIGKRFYNGREMMGNIGTVDFDIRTARYNVAIANQSHEALLKHRERLAVKAPFDGKVRELPVPQNGSVKRGDIIAVFEKPDERFVTAFLTQDEVVKVALNDEVSVYFPALNASLRAVVKAVDRTSGFNEEISRRFSWRGAEDRSAEVRLDLADNNDAKLLAEVTPGLPAVVLFVAQSSNPILAAVWRKIASLFL